MAHDKRLAAFGAGVVKGEGGGAANPQADPRGVDPDRDDALEPDDVQDDADDDDVARCIDCDAIAAYNDPAAVLEPSLPSEPLCRSHILERL